MLIRAGVLAVVALAVSGLMREPMRGPLAEISGERATSLVTAEPAAPAAPDDTKRWSVKVDGWTIEVDTVSGLRLPPPEVPADEVPSPLSPYDRMIARHADAAGFDWRFIAALIYEESRFDPDSVSHAGAYGLMQLLPAAAQDVGSMRFHEPEANVRTGVRYLQRLEREYSKARDRDRLALMLAAYNMGMGHVQDAQALARRFGYDPYRWDGSMDVMVSLLEEPQVYSQLPKGYAQGRAVVDYVSRVLDRYGAYRQQLPAVPPHRTASRAPRDGADRDRPG